jgi:hypothetical protein
MAQPIVADDMSNPKTLIIIKKAHKDSTLCALIMLT